jgi:hypothetical protein
MRACWIICLGFGAGFVTACLCLVALGFGAGVDPRVECTLAAVRALPEDETLATAGDAAVFSAKVKACAAVLPGEPPSE